MNPDNFDFSEDYEEPSENEGPSKSSIKREMTALQKMGTRLTELGAAQLALVPMSESLRSAIALARNIRKNEGRRRQLQYIGKLMRYEEIDAIRQKLDEFDTSSKAFAQTLHHIEGWRDRLLGAASNEALTELIEQYPHCEVQTLRQLVRKAQHDVSTQKNTGAGKKLFQHLCKLIDSDSD